MIICRQIRDAIALLKLEQYAINKIKNMKAEIKMKGWKGKLRNLKSRMERPRKGKIGEKI